MPVATPRTLFAKLWDRHVVSETPGHPSLLYVDLHLVHEVTSPQAFAGLAARGLRVRRPDLTVATVDHAVPTADRSLPIADGLAAAQIQRLGENCRAHGIPLYGTGSAWVASTCSTSLVPMPNASAPKAPWVAVWESPQTIVMPGWVKPCSGPTI